MDISTANKNTKGTSTRKKCKHFDLFNEHERFVNSKLLSCFGSKNEDLGSKSINVGTSNTFIITIHFPICSADFFAISTLFP